MVQNQSHIMIEPNVTSRQSYRASYFRL